MSPLPLLTHLSSQSSLLLQTQSSRSFLLQTKSFSHSAFSLWTWPHHPACTPTSYILGERRGVCCVVRVLAVTNEYSGCRERELLLSVFKARQNRRGRRRMKMGGGQLGYTSPYLSPNPNVTLTSHRDVEEWTVRLTGTETSYVVCIYLCQAFRLLLWCSLTVCDIKFCYDHNSDWNLKFIVFIFKKSKIIQSI